MIKFIFMFMLSASAFAYPDPDVDRVREAMKTKVGISHDAEDARLVITKLNEPLCGNEGKSIMVQFQVRRLERVHGLKGTIRFRSRFETVKTYGVSVKDASGLAESELSAAIMDAETCTE